MCTDGSAGQDLLSSGLSLFEFFSEYIILVALRKEVNGKFLAMLPV